MFNKSSKVLSLVVQNLLPLSNIKERLGNIFEEGEVFVNSLSVHHVLGGDGQALKRAARVPIVNNS